MANYALMLDDVVQNVIVAKAGEWLDQHVADEGYDEALDTSTIDVPVGPGYVRQGQTFVPPVVLASNKIAVSSVGNDAATVTYTDNRPNPPASVDGTVNDQATTLALTNGVGSFDVISANSGDTITITFPDVAPLVIGVT